MDPLVTGWRRIEQRDTCWLNVLGRLAPGVDRRSAQTETNLRMQTIAARYPASHQGPNQITLDPLWRSPFGMGFALYVGLSMLWCLAGVLLLLSCANVANLVLVRAFARRRELAIRLSLGASRLRLARQFLAESLLLGLAAGGAALVATSWTAGLLSALIPSGPVPIVVSGRVDSRVLLVTLAFSIVSSVILGTLPALRSSRIGPPGILKEDGGSVSAALHKSRLARGLVVAQISFSFVLLICAGLFIRSYRNAQGTDPGFDRSRLLLASFDLQSLDYSPARRIAFDRQLLTKLEGLPGVRSVSLANAVPLFAGGHSQEIAPEGYVPRPHESMEVGRINVGPGYFRTLGIPLVAGRDISGQDGPGAQRVIVVNQSLAERYWPGQDPLGKRLKAYGSWFTVVGVARNARFRELKGEVPPMIFPPLFQVYYQDPTIHLRVTSDPYAYVDPLKRAVRELNGELALFDVVSLSDVAERGSWGERLGGFLVGILAVLALVLASVGVYGVVAYTTRQRTHEIGIRLALGADPARIRLLILAEGMLLALVGSTIGLFAALAVTRALEQMLFGVTPTDLPTYGGVALLLGLVTFAACYIPARRASRLAPLLALREQ